MDIWCKFVYNKSIAKWNICVNGQCLAWVPCRYFPGHPLNDLNMVSIYTMYFGPSQSSWAIACMQKQYRLWSLAQLCSLLYLKIWELSEIKWHFQLFLYLVITLQMLYHEVEWGHLQYSADYEMRYINLFGIHDVIYVLVESIHNSIGKHFFITVTS